jgi:hypothetical protein
MNLRHSVTIAASLVLCGVSACAHAPCPCQSVVPAHAVVAACGPKLAAPFAAKPLLVWDGEGTGNAAKGWSSCQQGTQCKTALEVKPSAGHDGTNGIEFSAKGPEWMGFGWNWFGWYPATAGTDISKYKSLALWIRVDGAPGARPEPETIRVSLASSSRGGKDDTEAVPINDYAPGFSDGQWHQVVVPIEPMLRGKGEAFDTSKAWALTIGAWNQGEREYTIQVDEIQFI